MSGAAAAAQAGAKIVAGFANYFAGRRASRMAQAALREGWQATSADFVERGRQLNLRASAEMGVRARRAIQERGRIVAALSEGFAGGNTYQRIVRDGYSQESHDLASIEVNRQLQFDQTQRELRSAATQTRNAFVDIYNSSPTLGGTLLNAVAGASESYMQYKLYNAQIKG
jgi:hypothetical protein